MKQQLTLTIDCDSLNDLLEGSTNNPVCEMEVCELLRKVIQSGGRVIVTGTGRQSNSLLSITEMGDFSY